MTIDRRALLTDIGALICAPASVRASSLMPVKEWLDPAHRLIVMDVADYIRMNDPLLAGLIDSMRHNKWTIMENTLQEHFGVA